MIDADNIDDIDTELDAPEGIPDPGDTLRKDVEEAVAQNLAKKGAPTRTKAWRAGRTPRPAADMNGSKRTLTAARKSGTTIQAAVRDYAEAEGALRRDFAGGIEHICQKFSVDPRALVGVLYQRYFRPGGNQQMAAMARQHQQSQIDRSIEEFAADPRNEHFAELRMDMARLVQVGKADSLKSAYNMALKAHPTLHAKAMMSRAYAKRDAEMNAMRKRRR
jgi:hypothetical protein